MSLDHAKPDSAMFMIARNSCEPDGGRFPKFSQVNRNPDSYVLSLNVHS